MPTFTAGQVVSASDLNLLSDAPYFKGSITTATAVTASANIAFPVVEDSHSGWNATNKNYVVPVAGLYLVTFAIKVNATAAAPSLILRKNATNATYGPNYTAAAYAGFQIIDTIRCVVGDTIAAQVNAAYTTQSDAPANNNFLIIQRVRA